MLCKRALGKPRFDLSKDMPIVLSCVYERIFDFTRAQNLEHQYYHQKVIIRS